MTQAARTDLLRIGMNTLGVLAVVFGLVSDLWYLGMIGQWLIPWDSLGIMYAITMPT